MPIDPLNSENWISESSMTSGGAPDASGSGGDTTLTIEITQPPPAESIPCDTMISGTAKASGPNASGTQITVYAPDGLPCGQGQEECTFEYTPHTDECAQTLTFTAKALDCEDATATLTAGCMSTKTPPQSVEIIEQELEHSSDAPPGDKMGRFASLDG